MTRPRKGREKQFQQLLEDLKEGMSEHIKHYKDYFIECVNYKRGHSVTKSKELVTCKKCLNRIENNKNE